MEIWRSGFPLRSLRTPAMPLLGELYSLKIYSLWYILWKFTVFPIRMQQTMPFYSFFSVLLYFCFRLHLLFLGHPLRIFWRNQSFKQKWIFIYIKIWQYDSIQGIAAILPVGFELSGPPSPKRHLSPIVIHEKLCYLQ